MKKALPYLLLTILMAVMFASTASAEGIRPRTFEFTPFAGGYFFSDEDDLDNNFTAGVGFAYNYTKHLAAEVGLHGVWTEQDDNHNEDASIGLLRLDALYHFLPENRLVPYLSAGIGALTITRDAGEDDSDALVNWGGGVKYFITETLALRADLRHVIPFSEARSNVMANLGLAFIFGGTPAAATPPPPAPAPAPVATPAAPVDSDGDGVYDPSDRCPNTPRGVAVDQAGCPLDSDRDGVYDHLDKCPGTPYGTKVDSDGCPIPLDSDHDGVLDDKDKCPNTPAGVKVDAVGCPLDSDKDGVYDHLDKCPGTPAGAKVDEVGCTIKIKKPVRIDLKVLFDTNKSVVKDEYRDEIKKVADFMTQYPETKAVIEGHTDDRGSAEYNKKLSQDRADAVMRYLIEKLGVPANRISAVGYGEEQPTASNKTEEGRAQNRRVIGVISGTAIE